MRHRVAVVLPAALTLTTVALAVLGAAPSTALAATRTEVTPAHTSSSFFLRASNRYYLEFEAVPEGRAGAAEVTVGASYERYKDELLSVTYSSRGRIFGDGGFEAKFPGIGRVRVRFKEETAHKVRYEGGTGCGDEVITTRRGVFVGFAGFHGKAGFTTAMARRGDGQIRETARQVCHRPVAPEVEEAPTPEVPPPTRSATIFASGKSGPAAVTFSSAGARIDEPGGTGSGLPTIDFNATYKSKLRGMGVTARVYVDSAHSNLFSVPTPIGALTDATIEPPKPFSGSGIFHLETPTIASWTGDLAVAMPGVGTVPLAGPGITARLCEASGCVPTPPGS